MNFLESVNKFCIDNRVTITEIEETCGLEKGTLLKWDKIDEASFLLSTNVQDFYKLISDGELTAILVNGTKKIFVKVFEEYQDKLLKQGGII